MKKQKQHLSVALLSLSLALFSCKGTVDETYTNVIPADASVVISANLNELMSKAGYKDYQSIGKAVEDLYAETLSSTPEIVNAIMENPKESGIDLDAPVYVFQLSDGKSAGVVLRIDNKEKVDVWLQPILTGMGNMSPSRIHLDENTLLAFDQNSGQAWQQPATPETQFNQSAGFRKMKEMDGDVRYCFSTRDLCAKYGARAITAQPAIYTETLLVGSCNFDKGSASLTVALIGKTPEADAGIAAFKAALRPSKGKFTKYLPESTTMMIGISGKGEDYLNYLARTPLLEGAVYTNYRFWEPMFKAIDGDAVIALTGISESGISIIAYAELLPEVTESQMKEILSRWGLENANWGIKDNCLYWTTDKVLADNAFKEASPSFDDTKYGKNSDGKPAYILMDIAKTFNNASLGEEAIQQMGANSKYLSFLSATEYELNENYEFVIKLNLKDENENVLKQVVQLLAN